MQEWYLVLEVSSIQGCPYRGVPLYMYVLDNSNGSHSIRAIDHAPR